MTDKTKAERLAEANAFLLQVSSFGRRFFHSASTGRVASFELDGRGRIRLRDDYTGQPVDLSAGGPWKGFSHGGTLRGLVDALACYIRTGVPIEAGHLGPWPDTLCRGDLWGYGKDEMARLRAAVRHSGCIEHEPDAPAEAVARNPS